tara:strand:+ start:408 stop:1109 length:702 start_codon:yes stop_codon:yes gene_type:complete
MSIKSLLQLILLLLIFLILGGIYFLYFYSSPIKNEIISDNNINKINTEIINGENVTDQERLNENTSTNIDDKDKLQNKNEKIIKLEKAQRTEKKNLTKEIEYITTNKDGDIFKILAKFGKTNFKNSSILDLELVAGMISSTKRSEIYISSDKARYNYNNQNSQFYSNVEIKYDNKIITCNNLDLNINENYAVAYNDVKIKDDNSILKAQMITLNISTKDININSQDKIKIFAN